MCQFDKFVVNFNFELLQTLNFHQLQHFEADAYLNNI
jgi:hypothetical protein